MSSKVLIAEFSLIFISCTLAEGQRDSPGTLRRFGQSCWDELQFCLISCQLALFLFVLSVAGTFRDTFYQLFMSEFGDVSVN